MPTQIRIRHNGPYVIDLSRGDVGLTDHQGTAIALPAGATSVSLCRCGASAHKPLCDGTHSRLGLNSAPAAGQPAGRTGTVPPSARG